MVEIVLEVGDDAGRSVLEEELNEIEGLNVRGGTLRIFFQLLLFLSLSQMNSLMRCHFSLGEGRGTSCRRRWRSHAVAEWRPASFPQILPPLASRLGRRLRSWLS